MAKGIGCELAELQHMTVGELREKYHQLFGEPTRASNKNWLFKRIAWRIQALAEGDLSERARRRAEYLARDADLRTTAPTAPIAATSVTIDERVPPSGNVLTRVYRGRAHHVAVVDGGFEYEGRTYRSLSAVAKVITGSHWNGRLFFGVSKPRTQKEDANGQ